MALPECFAFIGAAKGEAQAAAEPLFGPTMQRYRELAKETKTWLSLGGFQEKIEGDEKSRGVKSSKKLFLSFISFFFILFF